MEINCVNLLTKIYKLYCNGRCVFMEFDWDAEDIITDNANRGNKILDDFSGVNFMSEVVEGTLSLVDLDIFIRFCKNYKTLLSDFGQDSISRGFLEVDSSIYDDFPQLKYATIFKDPSFYLPSIFGDVVISRHYEFFMTYLTAIMGLKTDETINMRDALNFANRVMILLDEFYLDDSFDNPNQDFFYSIKLLKWDKRANKLLNKLDSIMTDIINLITETALSHEVTSFSNGFLYFLTFLSACSAVKNGHDKMLVDDVVCAYRTFYKLLDMDYEDLLAKGVITNENR